MASKLDVGSFEFRPSARPRLARADELLTDDDAAALLRLSPSTLEGWRRRGEGPRFLKLGHRSVRYRLRDLVAWAEAHAVETK